MNNKANYKKGKRREIVELGLHTGGIPLKDIPLYSAKVECMRKQMMIMEKEGVLKKVKTDLGYVDVIANYSEKLKKEEDIPKKYRAYYENFGINDTYKLTADVEQSKARLYRQAEAFIFMYGSKIKAKIDEKNSIFKPIPLDGYYTAREIKSCITESDKACSGVRITGLVAIGGEAYSVYDANKEVIKFANEDIMKYRIEQDILHDKGIEKIKGCILLTEGYSTQKKYLGMRSDKRDYTENLYKAYENIYAINLNHEGQQMMKIMSIPRWDKITYNMFVQDKPVPRNEAIVCDGKDEEGYYLVYCVPNIERLKEFIKQAVFFNDKSKFKIICFNTQTEFIMEIANEYCEIYEVDFEEYVKEMEGVNNGKDA